MEGAPGTLYEGEKFQLLFKFSNRYPFDSPQVSRSSSAANIHRVYIDKFQGPLTFFQPVMHGPVTGDTTCKAALLDVDTSFSFEFCLLFSFLIKYLCYCGTVYRDYLSQTKSKCEALCQQSAVRL